MTRQTFEAQAFHPDLGNEMVTGEIFFVGWTLRFRSDAVELEIPFDRLAVEIADEDDRIFFTDPEQPDLKITTAAEELFKYRTLPQVEKIYQQLAARLSRREISRRTKVLLYVVGICVILGWLGTVAVHSMVGAIVARVSPEFEAKMGKEAMAEVKSRFEFITDTNYVDALRSLALPLLRALPGSPTNFTFYVVDEKIPNAFALPGGHIVVHTGLMDLTDRPEELLGVIAHEVAHVTQKHHVRYEIAAGGPFLILKMYIRGRGGMMSVLTSVSALVIGQGFSQEYEAEADDVAWQYLVKANIDPRGMTEMFRKFKAYIDKQPVLDIPQPFSSHPALEERIKRLESKWQSLPRKSGFIDFDRGEQPK